MLGLRFLFRLSTLFTSLSLFAAWGCSCDEQGQPYVDLDGSLDGGGDTGADGSARDASTPDARRPRDGGLGDLCANAMECASGLCTATETQEGVCCDDEANICGGACCQGAELCFGGACVTPGQTCRLERDCPADSYCEFELGSGQMGGESCSVVRDGKCLPLPKSCADAEPGELCVAEPGACEFRPAVGDLDAVVQWEWNDSNATLPDFVDVWSTPMVGRVADSDCDDDVDRDDVPAVVFVSGELLVDDNDPLSGWYCSANRHDSPNKVCQRGVLRVLAGDDGRELLTLANLPNSIGFLGNTLSLGDIDRNGVLDIVVVTGEGKVVVLDGKGNVLMDAPDTVVANVPADMGWGGGTAIADIDQDGFAEIYFHGRVYTSKSGDLEPMWKSSVTPDPQKTLEFFADVDPSSPGLELVMGNALIAANGTPLWNRNDLDFGFAAVADLQNDGSPEIVYVASGFVHVLDPKNDGMNVFPAFQLGDVGYGGPPTIADFDGDGFPEIGVAQENAYYMLKPNLAQGELEENWNAPNHDKSSSVTGSTVFDFQGDGAAEVIYNDECYLWVYDGKTGNVRFAAPTKSFTATESNVVADIDADGHAEMLWIANRVSPSNWNCEDDGWTQADPVTKRPAWTRPADNGMWRGVRVYRDRANAWVGTRQIWNQHAYSVTNICTGEDSACSANAGYGEIPTQPLANWTQPWANNFRQNIQESGVFDAADATLDILVDCEEPSNVSVQLRNQGRVPLPEGVAINVYQRDGAQETMIGRVVSDRPVYPGRVLELTLTAPDSPRSTRFYAEIDSVDASFVECDASNNRSPERVRNGCGPR